MLQWLQSNESALWWLGLISAVTFFMTLIVVPWLLLRVPPDYFARANPPRERRFDRAHWLRSLLFIGRNLVGLLFVVTGVLMLLLPGQGVLVMLIGIMLMDFPGKQKLERWIVARPAVLRAINRWRRRMGHAPLVA